MQLSLTVDANQKRMLPHMSHTTVQQILQEHFKFRSYKYQLLRYVTAQDKEVHYTLCYTLLSRHEDKPFTVKIIFSDKAIFHVLENINQHSP
jgi:hypothetical protein